MTDFYDALETRSSVEREAALMAALPLQVAHAQAHSTALGELLGGVDARQVTDRAALARLPVLRKGDLHDRQKVGRAAGRDAFGGLAAVGYGATMPRVFASPGPIYEPEGTARDYWRRHAAIATCC